MSELSVNDANLVIPIRGSHIRDSLTLARQDQVGFRQAEMTWLETNNPLMKIQVSALFGLVHKDRGIEAAFKVMAGKMLGNHAVRLCVADDLEAYKVAKLNYHRNHDIDQRRLSLPGTKVPTRWDTTESLATVFGDEDLVAAIMNVDSDESRYAAAVAIAYFCLSEVPD